MNRDEIQIGKWHWVVGVGPCRVLKVKVGIVLVKNQEVIYYASPEQILRRMSLKDVRQYAKNCAERGIVWRIFSLRAEEKETKS